MCKNMGTEVASQVCNLLRRKNFRLKIYPDKRCGIEVIRSNLFVIIFEISTL